MRWPAEWPRSPVSAAAAEPNRCEHCAHFCNDPFRIEAAFPGLTAMSSGSADVRACDGLCARRGIYLGFDSGCDLFVGR
jgi:hypothetical protein